MIQTSILVEASALAEAAAPSPARESAPWHIITIPQSVKADLNSDDEFFLPPFEAACLLAVL